MNESKHTPGPWNEWARIMGRLISGSTVAAILGESKYSRQGARGGVAMRRYICVADVNGPISVGPLFADDIAAVLAQVRKHEREWVDEARDELGVESMQAAAREAERCGYRLMLPARDDCAWDIYEGGLVR